MLNFITNTIITNFMNVGSVWNVIEIGQTADKEASWNIMKLLEISRFERVGVLVLFHLI